MRKLEFLVIPLALSALSWSSGARAVALTFDATVARALESSTRVKATAHELEAAVERRRASWADAGPRVSADFSEVHFEDEQTAQLGAQEVLLRPKVTRSASITASQPLTGAVALIAKAGLDGTTEDVKALALAQAKIETAFAAAEAWLRAAEKEKLVKVATESVAAAEKQSQDGAALERAGRINRGDLLRLQLATSEAKARLAGARAAAEIAFAVLRETVGMPAGTTIEVQGAPEAQVVAEKETPAPAGDVQGALKSRLEPQQAALGVEIAGFYKKLAYSQFSPNVNVFVKWERNLGELAGGLGGTPKRDAKTYGITANWLLWDNMSRVFQVRQASEEVARTEALKSGAEAAIRLDVASAEAMLKASRESLALAVSAVTQADESYRIEEARFKTGSRSATDLILSEASRTGARGRLVTARTDFEASRLKLAKALGQDRPKL